MRGTVMPYSERGWMSTSISTTPSMPSTTRTNACGTERPIEWPSAPAPSTSASVTETRPVAVSWVVRSTIVSSS